MSIIASGTTSGTALVSTGNTNGNLVFQTNGTTTAMTISTAQVVSLNSSLALLGATSGSVTLTPPAVAGTQAYTLPTAQPTASGQALVATTAGVMSWATPSASPGGSTTQVQYNNAGAFGGISGFTTDGTRVTASTTIGVGGATPSASGAGITFPATQSASSDVNTLDDYEEGTWTPVYNSSNSNMTVTQSNTGYYRKVGSIVHVWIRAFVSAIGSSGTGDLQMTGLPFVVQTGNSFMGGVVFSGIGNFSSTTTPFTGFFNQNTTTWTFSTKSSADARNGTSTTPSSALAGTSNFDFWYGCYISN
jgi:hypothetical protein